MNFLDSYAVAALTVFGYATFLFIIAQLVKDNSIADIAWGPGFIIATAAVMFYRDAFGSRNILLFTLILIWATRLSIRIFLRNHGRGEDWRYKKWREEWGSLFLLRSYLQVFLLQGAVLVINLSPVIIADSGRSDLFTVTDLAGIAIWGIGFYFEAMGDYQLDQYVKNRASRGPILDTGLWRYTRHPNYFGEVTMWWGIYVIALGAPLGYLGFIGPAIITVMLVFVSGIPMTERAMENRPAFQEYKRRTSAFFPWFPGKSGK